MTDYTNALARLLMQQQQPQDEFVADYASSAPLPGGSANGRRYMHGGMTLAHILGAGASAYLPFGGVPFAIGNVGMAAMNAREASRANQESRGQHPDQSQMDHDLRMMQYYGQPPRGFGPK